MEVEKKYTTILENIKTRVKQAQLKAALSVNRECTGILVKLF